MRENGIALANYHTQNRTDLPPFRNHVPDAMPMPPSHPDWKSSSSTSLSSTEEKGTPTGPQLQARASRGWANEVHPLLTLNNSLNPVVDDTWTPLLVPRMLPVVLVGNKTDRRDDREVGNLDDDQPKPRQHHSFIIIGAGWLVDRCTNEQVDWSDGQAIANRYGIPHFETSAKHDIGIVTPIFAIPYFSRSRIVCEHICICRE
jgi:hypothetical protein